MTDVYDYVNSTGVIMTDTPEILAEVQAEYVGVFGAGLNLAPNTPQGGLITAETAGRTAVADNNAALANQINPNIAGGVYLDALLALFGAFRSPATQSIVSCDLTGVAGTSIPQGSQITDTAGDLFQIVSTTVIPLSGSITDVLFESVEYGPIPAATAALTTIVSNILGWETVTNPAPATLGTSTQSDVSARLLRANTLGGNGRSLAAAIQAAVYLLATGTSMTFRENVEDITEVIDEITMKSHSLYACVNSTSTVTQIAQAISNAKSGGCGYNNGLGIPQSVTVTNAISGQPIDVLFDTPSMVLIGIQVTVHMFTAIQNVETAVKNAILQYVNGNISGEPGWVVGASASPYQLAGAINILVPGLFVQDVQLAVISFTQQGTIVNTMDTVTDLTYNAPVGGFVGIAVGMGVTGTYIPTSTTVASLVGSTGITMNNTATGDATEILTFSVASPSYGAAQIPIGIWQQAITTDGNIAVSQV